jgi:DNA-directed RNA polymerase specialized sigma24 family protein
MAACSSGRRSVGAFLAPAVTTWAEATVRDMTRDHQSDRNAVEARFAEIFAHLDFISTYARRRGARDPDGIAAEAMATAWCRLADVPTADARPWLIVTARNLLLAERRSEPESGRQPLGDIHREAPAEQLPSEWDLDPDLARGLRVLPDRDHEALLLIAWDDLTPGPGRGKPWDLPDRIPGAAPPRSAPAQRSPD